MTRHKVWNAAHGPAHVAAHSSGREYAPRRAPVRAALSVLLLALVLLSSPTDALADSNPSVVYSDDGLYVVSPCSNGFDAALTAIGLFSVRPRLTADMRAKLSNASTGGDFYALAARFQQTNDTLEGFGNSVYIGILTYNVATYGAGNIMQATGVTAADIANARRDFNVIQNGGSLGGGGGVGDGEYVTFTTKVRYVNYSSWAFKITANGVTYTSYPKDVADKGYTLLPQTLTLRIPKSVFGTDGEYLQDATSVVVKAASVTTSSSGTFLNANSPGILVCYGSAAPHEDSFIFSQGGTQYTGTWYDSYALSSGTYRTTGTVSGGLACTFDGSTITVTRDTPVSFNPLITNNPTYSFTTGTAAQLFVSGASSGGGNVTDNWPHDVITGHPMDEPAVPTPPVYDPITYTNPTDDPLPTPPPETPITPVDPIVTTDPTNTTPQDYTPWLSAILNELRNFHRDAIGLANNVMDALATHCVHITTTIMDETEWLYDQLKAQIRAGVQAILNGLDQNCTEMMNYLEDLAEWLADQLQFTFNIDNSNNVDVPAYDDSSVIGWLKRIYNAIRSIKGPTIGTPVTEKDVEDGFDWWAWILSLLDQLFDNVISQTVGEVESFLEEFRNLFPLSIPWDMVALLTMFAGTPTTPEVTLTFPAIASIGLPEYDLEIDLEPFDNAAYTIRQAEQIVFAFYLLFKTQWLLDTLKSATDAAGEFVEGLLT